MIREHYDSETKLSWVLAALAGLLAAAAFTHSEGYFVTFMTGNAGRAVLGVFNDNQWLSISAAALLFSFLAGVVVASLFRRYVWPSQPHGGLVLTAVALVAATLVDWLREGGPSLPLPLLPILLVAFGVGALNTTFVRDGEVSIPLSYVTGTVVKLGQGIERHISGGSIRDWLGHFLLFSGYTFGAVAGGIISLFAGGTWMLAIASGICAAATVYTHRYVDRRGLWQ
ncbi:YoaK family protein [[Mycobacterium] nativiensis]|uniref:YoaK family protein n=1 Tax=[Mycobacterium] nativiensis TaxID=2855503 RepID=A0ABU5Y0J6_9MYCO|nr:YoaK family protein [Mycolicibacter sp. MYC340]MEB3033643.1 YoaK family protein [Mycolicibacter sp. MYC340]